MRSHYSGIDCIKFISALMVVAIHSQVPYYWDVVCRVAVPFFFISSSFLFWYKEKPLIDFIKRMAVLYLVWFIIESPFVYIKFVNSNIWEFLRCLLFSNTFFASWYITASIEGMALCVLLSRRLNNATLLMVGVVFYSVALLGGGYFGVLPAEAQTFLLRIDGIVPLTNSFVTAFLYFVLGKIFSERCKYLNSANSLVETALVAISAVVLYICEVRYVHSSYRFTDTFVALPILAWVLLDFATQMNVWERVPVQLSSFFRKSSTFIYFWHLILLVLLSRLMIENGATQDLSPWIKFGITAPICISISSLFIWISSKWKWLRVLF